MVVVFPSHLLAAHDPGPLAPARDEKHNSVGPVLSLAERLHNVLATMKIKFV